MPIKIGLVGVLAMSVFAATGCSGGDSAAPASEAASTPTTGATTTAPSTPPPDTTGTDTTTPVTSSDEPQSTEPPTTTSAPTSTIAVEFVIGERVVALDPFLTLPTLQRTGVEVVGVFANGSFPTWLPPAWTDGVVDLGGYATANLEQLALLQPDSLVGLDGALEALPAEITAIAPVHTIEFSNANAGWRDGMRAFGELAGRPDAVEPDIEEVDERLAGLAADVAASGLTTAAFVRVRADDIRLHGANHFAGSLLTEAGFTLPAAAPARDDPEQNFVSLSPEQLDAIDADVVFVLGGGGGQTDAEGEAALEALESNPLWQVLPAVRAGRVHVVGEHWGTGEATAAGLVLDDIAAAVGS